MAEVRIIGLDSAIYKFKELDVGMQTTIINDVLDVTADECKSIVEENAPEGAGTHGEHLKDQIEVEGKGKSRKIGPNKNAFWGRFNEKGTGERQTKDRENWPGHSTGSMPEHQFLEPAIEDQRVEDVAAASLRAHLEAL